NIVLSLHLSQQGQALGRRIKGVTRTLIHLECPEPMSPERLRLWVEKSYAKKPPALGVTMGEGGNDHDCNPPEKAEPNRGGRPSDKKAKACQFILDALVRCNDQRAAALAASWVRTGEKESTFWNARDQLVSSGRIVQDGKPYILHMVKEGTDDGTPY